MDFCQKGVICANTVNSRERVDRMRKDGASHSLKSTREGYFGWPVPRALMRPCPKF
jgi:hypothetical protein